MADIDKILAERGKTHGDFSNQAECAQDLKKAFYLWTMHNKPTPYMKEAVDMILHKLARVATGDPSVQDHWDDIAGYATLVSDRVARIPVSAVKKPAPPHTITGQVIAGEIRGLVPESHSDCPVPIEPGLASARD